MTDINTLIHLNIELEGLLRVLAGRDSAEAKTILADKFAKYSAGMSEYLKKEEDSAGESVSPSLDNEPAVFPEPLQSVHDTALKEEEAEDTEVVDQTEAATHAIERGQSKHYTEAQGVLLKSFTLNDKFRFIRDIFGGDERDFTDTVAVIENMSSYKEAADYIAEDLMLDTDDSAVADFLDIIARYF